MIISKIKTWWKYVWNPWLKPFTPTAGSYDELGYRISEVEDEEPDFYRDEDGFDEDAYEDYLDSLPAGSFKRLATHHEGEALNSRRAAARQMDAISYLGGDV